VNSSLWMKRDKLEKDIKKYEVSLRKIPGNSNRYISWKKMKGTTVKRLFAIVESGYPWFWFVWLRCFNVGPLDVPRVEKARRCSSSRRRPYMGCSPYNSCRSRMSLFTFANESPEILVYKNTKVKSSNKSLVVCTSIVHPVSPLHVRQN